MAYAGATRPRTAGRRRELREPFRCYGVRETHERPHYLYKVYEGPTLCRGGPWIIIMSLVLDFDLWALSRPIMRWITTERLQVGIPSNYCNCTALGSIFRAYPGNETTLHWCRQPSIYGAYSMKKRAILNLCETHPFSGTLRTTYKTINGGLSIQYISSSQKKNYLRISILLPIYHIYLAHLYIYYVM